MREGGETHVAWGTAGNAIANPHTAPGILAQAYGSSVQTSLRIGLPRAELGVFYGFTRLGGELRLAALDEDRGSPLSLAPSAGVAWMPWEGGGWWGRVGFDVSRRLGDARVVPLAGLYLSHGPQRYRHRIGKAWGGPITNCQEGWPGTPCGTRNPHSTGRVAVMARATRLSAPLGVALQEPQTGFSWQVALLPHVDLRSDVSSLRCEGCREGVTPQDFREVVGAALMTGITFLTPSKTGS